MTSQDQPQDLTSTMQELMDRMAQMQAELAQLKQHAQTLPSVFTATPTPTPLIAKPPSTLSGSRRKTLKRLGLALLGGAAAATVSGFSVAEAKLISTAKPLGTTTSKVGAIIILPGVNPPTGNPPSYSGSYYNYGLLVSSDTSPINLNNLPTNDVGVYGVSANGNGIYGKSANAAGVVGLSTDYPGVAGFSTNGNGVYRSSNSTSGVAGDGLTGVYGQGNSYGVSGQGLTGVYGYGDQQNSVGVWGYAEFSGMKGVYGEAVVQNSTGVYGYSNYSGNTNSWAGYFEADVHVTGAFSASTKAFKIDHPLDPSNKYLYHTSVESPDMKNIYDGVVTLDEQGTATVEMPEWFEALNTDFRYQLTCLDQYAPVFIAGRIKEHKFKIAGGIPGQEISWLVTGIRQDPWAKSHRTPVEQVKREDEKGKYLHPELFGQPAELSISPRPQRPVK